MLITNSNVKHQLTGSEYPARRSACLESAVVLGKDSLRDVSLAMLGENKDKFDDMTYRRVKHVVTEIPRYRVHRLCLLYGCPTLLHGSVCSSKTNSEKQATKS